MTIRIFARVDLNDRESPMTEFASHDDACEVRGGGGDEIEYNTVTDSFTFELGSGVGQTVIISNPCPVAPLIDAAELVADLADAAWMLMERN